MRLSRRAVDERNKLGVAHLANNLFLRIRQHVSGLRFGDGHRVHLFMLHRRAVLLLNSAEEVVHFKRIMIDLQIERFMLEVGSINRLIVPRIITIAISLNDMHGLK